MEVGMVATGQSKRRTKAEKSLLAFLVRSGTLDAARAGELQHWAEEKQVSVAQALTAHGLLSEEEMARAIAKGLRLPVLNLDALAFDDATPAYVNEEIATRCVVVPLRKQGDFLTFVRPNAVDEELIRQIE